MKPRLQDRSQKRSRIALTFLNNVGLNYLTLSRSAGTLSGGESQRIRLATQIGSNLSGVLYILDEPSIGLHQRDNDRLIASLKKMRDLGNTLIVVEHDEDTMREADYLIDVGPGAGVFGERSLQQELQSRWLVIVNPSPGPIFVWQTQDSGSNRAPFRKWSFY